MTTKKQILESDDLRRETMTIPEWGGAELHLSTMTGRERVSLLQLANKYPDDSWNAVLIVSNVRNEKGELFFTEEDLYAVSGKNSEILNRIGKKIEDLSSLGAAGLAAEKKA